jgi:hypothetical protein
MNSFKVAARRAAILLTNEKKERETCIFQPVPLK